jgi:Zn-dependent protease
VSSAPALLLERAALFIPVLLSLSVHEWAHAWVAFRLGDDTAARLGRMTLNPLAHIDPVGTLLLPLLGVPFGWAKPVPINPLRFDRRVRMGTGLALSAAAGPLSNFALAALSVTALVGLAKLAPAALAQHPALLHLLYSFALINLALGCFNLFPVPPLDGSRIAEALVPERLRASWDVYVSAAPFLLVALVAAPYLTGHSLLAWPLGGLQTLIESLLQ